AVDVNHNRVTLDSLAIHGGDIALWMERNHHMNLEAWATPPDTTMPPWVTVIRRLGVHDTQVRFEARQGGPRAVFELNGVEALISDLSTAVGGKGKLSANARLFENATCSAAGEIGLEPSADLQVEVKGFPLRSCQPYMDHLNRVLLLGGDAAGK